MPTTKTVSRAVKAALDKLATLPQGWISPELEAAVVAAAKASEWEGKRAALLESAKAAIAAAFKADDFEAAQKAAAAVAAASAMAVPPASIDPQLVAPALDMAGLAVQRGVQQLPVLLVDLEFEAWRSLGAAALSRHILPPERPADLELIARHRIAQLSEQRQRLSATIDAWMANRRPRIQQPDPAWPVEDQRAELDRQHAVEGQRQLDHLGAAAGVIALADGYDAAHAEVAQLVGKANDARIAAGRWLPPAGASSAPIALLSTYTRSGA